MAGLDQVRRLLAAAENAAPVDAVEAVTHEVALRLSATAVSILIADTSGRALVRLTRAALEPEGSPRAGTSPDGRYRFDGPEAAETVPFDGGPMERVVRSQVAEVLAPAERGDAGSRSWTVLAPVTERGEVIGVLEAMLPEEPAKEDVAEVASLAHLLAFVLIANRRHTDLFEWGHRSRPLSLSAEIQQRLLPASRACEGGAFALAAWLEPAADIAGDTFDYSLARDTLHLSMTDAMGHGVAASLTATLCVGALRGARRRGASLEEQAREAATAVNEHGIRTGTDDFVTGVLGRADLRAGHLTLVNAGHVAPLLARGDEVVTLSLPVNLPFGVFADAEYEATELDLLPGDRLVLVTDGMLERSAATIDLPSAIRASAGQHPREAVAFLANSVLEATGHALRDDATVLCLDWYGGHGGLRDTAEGADVNRTSRS